MGGSTLLRLTAMCLVSSIITNIFAASLALDTSSSSSSSSSSQNPNILTRQSSNNQVCGGQEGYEQCGASFPDDFCCGSGQQCVRFSTGGGSNNFGAICCDAGDTCTSVIPIPCNATLFNATLYPHSPIHLSSVPETADLERCDDGCCPPGYVCRSGACVLASEASSSAAPSSTVSLSTIAPTATTTSDPSSTPDADSSSSTHTPYGSAAANCNGFPPPAVLVGFFTGMAAGSLLTFLLTMCLNRHRRSHSGSSTIGGSTIGGGGKSAMSSILRCKPSTDSALGPVRAHISDPIYQPDNERIDFLRRNTRTGKRSPRGMGTPGTRSTTATTISSTSDGRGSGGAGVGPPLGRVRSLFSRTPTHAASEKLGGHAKGANQGLGVNVGAAPPVPVTPERQIRREPSTESIPILSPPEAFDDRPGDRQTTFGDVLKAVGLNVREPMPFMGSPGLVDPRARGVDGGRVRG